MFIKIQDGEIETNHETERMMMQPYGELPREYVPIEMPVSLTQRVLRGEPLWFEDRRYDFNAKGITPFRNHALIGQIGNIPLLAQRFQASGEETKVAIKMGQLPFDAALEARVSLEYSTVATYELEDIYTWHWEHKSHALARLISSKEAVGIPYLMLFGVPNGSEDTGQSNCGMPDYDLEATPTAAQLKAETAFKSFVEHVHIAATCALDSPQEVTVGDASASNLIKFRNSRLSPTLRGLVISLPSGGVLFFRDAKYDLSTGSIVYGRNTRISKKTLARKIIMRYAEDLAWMLHSEEILGLPRSEITRSWLEWCNTP